MKVLVTGHQGYLGTVMSEVLSGEGHEVVGLDSGLFAGCVLGPSPTDPPSFRVDLRDITAEHLAGFEAVIHLAALSNDPLGFLAPDLTYDINHHASVRLARIAKEAGVSRYLYASTCSVYGSAGDGLVNENAPLKPLTPYAESKVRVEDDVAAISDSGFAPVFLRNATAFGFSPRLRADIVLNNLVCNAVLTGEVRVLSDGTPWRPLVHVRDIAAAFLECLTAPVDVIHCAAFNVGIEENNQTVAQIAESAVAAVPNSTLAITGETGADPRSYRVDFSAIRKALPAYRAKWSIEAGAKELYERCLAGGLTDAMFRRSFTRLAHLKTLRESGAVDDTLRPAGR
ncbi:NAD-dependent epimerase/dehydratase family protein [Mycobacteroides abscessus]|uniref:NAD-dependent epimerase/dehydratase family protein n=1 Tax=Mycobacteroides abscessus TaxID=36809 RepID=UPI000241CD6C|nr:SDR family oxidoreductase [Mycobacteroides abscessus]EHM22798.1 NAD-dependent epimerase/dehydratase [Mycobacteroides abscessus subsp. bolletii BD]ORA29397.1 NAD-dependent dehydratase [Mycobacteroides abscessus subsp. bolletii]TPF65566.1 NAD-dependent dehydratase [Mycobacteroides abscessus subsp. bolletii]BBB40403.1 NAD-dependent dehydratase [Mycobacteroides abscessus subsp. bolletii BD]